MDIDRLRQLSGMNDTHKTNLFEGFDASTEAGIERNKGRRGQPVLGPQENEIPDTIVLNDRGNIIGVRAAGGMTILIYNTLIGEKEEFFLPDEAIDTLGSVESV